jgi:hypothetical protein
MPMPLDALGTLREVNKNLHSALVRLRPERTHCSAIHAQDFSELGCEISRAADLIRRVSLSSDLSVELKNESLQYRGNLEQLKHLLHDLQGRLLVEKVRLESATNHIAAAAAWAGTNTKTLRF